MSRCVAEGLTARWLGLRKVRVPYAGGVAGWVRELFVTAGCGTDVTACSYQNIHRCKWEDRRTRAATVCSCCRYSGLALPPGLPVQLGAAATPVGLLTNTTQAPERQTVPPAH